MTIKNCNGGLGTTGIFLGGVAIFDTIHQPDTNMTRDEWVWVRIKCVRF